MAERVEVKAELWDTGADATARAIQEAMDRAGYAPHDEAMRMQALAIGARLATANPKWPTMSEKEQEESIIDSSRWLYDKATGREW